VTRDRDAPATSPTGGVEERAIDSLLERAAEWSGYQPESVAREAVRRALAHEVAAGSSIADVMRRVAASDPETLRSLRAAVGVRETFLFRHPEQFDLLATCLPGMTATGVVRAWSAGCATGEEAWSLAATLVASVPGGDAGAPRIAVLGTDIHEPSLDVARAGRYRAGSLRASAPLLFPVVEQVGAGYQVLDALRPIATFVAHDLHDPEPGQFEVIFCRNVLIYFTRRAARDVLERLTRALAPGGLLVFGTMDVDADDLRGLTRVGRPEQMAFTTAKPTARRRRPTTRKHPARTRTPTLQYEAIALHRSALMWIELGGRGSAEKVLADLNRRYPDYLPGMLERALVHVRKGEHDTAATWMREVLRRAQALPHDTLVPGLEPLPATFYRDTASAYLERSSRKGPA
jgi:chemotaxis protein methyltransferase CheR